MLYYYLMYIFRFMLKFRHYILVLFYEVLLTLCTVIETFNIICSRHIIILSYSHIICGKFVIICFTFLIMMMASVRYYAPYIDVLYSVVFVTCTWFCANNIICYTSIFITMIKIHCFPFRLNEFLTKN